MMTFAEWKRLFPDTKVLQKNVGRFRSLFGSRGDPYEGYYYSSQTGVIPQKFRDNRLHPKTFLVGLTLEAGGKERAKVYPFADLNRAGVVNDAFAGRELLVSYCESAKSGVVFDRRMEGKLLTFEPVGEEKKGSCRLMRDKETDSRWVLLTGRAVEGPLKGKKLRMIPSTQSFWFGWKDFYPKSEIYRHGK